MPLPAITILGFGTREAALFFFFASSQLDFSSLLSFSLLTLLVGPDHAYTQYFKGFVQEPDKHTVLAGAGLLAAAKEELTNGHLKTETDTQSEAIQ